MDTVSYFKTISEQVRREYDYINSFKPVDFSIASDSASRVEGLLSTVLPGLMHSGIAEFIREEEKKYGPNDWHVAINVAKEMASSKFVKFDDELSAVEAGIRAGLAYITSGIVSAPFEGFVKAEFKRRQDGKPYIACYFGGPIRAAGGTAAAATIVIADALRAFFGIGSYDPSEDEIGRMKVEVSDYDEFEARLQYLPTINEIDFLMRNLPIEIEGDPTSEREVSAYKNLPRIKTNRIRGGVALVLSELAQKSSKLLKIFSKFDREDPVVKDFAFLEKYLVIKEKEHGEETKESEKTGVLPNYRYLEEIAAGRPVFSYPLTSGGFRLRYGRSRLSGLAAASINPATQMILGGFVATGSQLKVELPGKACAITTCSTIAGPIVRLKDGSVIKINDLDSLSEIISDVDKILYLGDILFNYGDFLEQGHVLMPSPFVEEWWERIVESKGLLDKAEGLKTFDEHIRFSSEFSIPLHPKFVDFWSQISYQELSELIKFVYQYGKVEVQTHIDGSSDKVISFPVDDKIKGIIEKLGTEHRVIDSKIVIEKADPFVYLLGVNRFSFNDISRILDKNSDVLSVLSEISGVKIMDTAGTFIGSRLGRPEKAKMREMETNPNVIFPVGESGGKTRNIVLAANSTCEAEFGTFFCESCKKYSIYPVCETCGKRNIPVYTCRVCGERVREKFHHGKETIAKARMKIDLSKYLEEAYARLGFTERLDVIKGVKGVFNAIGEIEFLDKGILRANYGLNVNKDGTVRFDAIEVPITHFKPKEIGVDIETLKKLGYEKDIYGKPLERSDQILQLFPQDVILPAYGDKDNNAADVFVRVSNMVDDLLVKFYHKEKLLDVKDSKDLVGKLVIGLAPHTSAGTVGRIIGFSKTQGLFMHPFFHASMRRNCDGDEAAVMLFEDALLNFDHLLLPEARGAKYMDAPLVISDVIDINSVDSEAYNLDIVSKYPLEFYEATLKYAKPSSVMIRTVKSILNDPFSPIFFTHDTDDLNKGVNFSAYKSLDTMSSKVEEQMKLESKIRAIDASDIARIIIEKHFIKDIKGNLRNFGTQEFRCTRCNARYTRPPLTGRCLKCGGNLVLTSSEGNIKKYLDISLQIAEKYKVPQFVQDQLILLKEELETIFGKREVKQVKLSAF